MWNEELRVGIREIDRQHRELFSQLGKLLDSCVRGGEQEELQNMVKFLDEYVVYHFATEEDLQLAHHYPDYELHKAEHQSFLHNFSVIKHEIASKGGADQLIVQINQMLIEWLKDHILREDRRAGDFLLNKVSEMERE